MKNYIKYYVINIYIYNYINKLNEYRFLQTTLFKGKKATCRK